MNQRLLPAALLLLSATGCMNISSVQRANTLGKGNVEIGLEPTVNSSGPQTVFRFQSPEPAISMSARYGLMDRLDLGARLGGPGAEVSAKLTTG